MLQPSEEKENANSEPDQHKCPVTRVFIPPSNFIGFFHLKQSLFLKIKSNPSDNHPYLNSSRYVQCYHFTISQISPKKDATIPDDRFTLTVVCGNLKIFF